jgi:hypothetical protein
MRGRESAVWRKAEAGLDAVGDAAIDFKTGPRWHDQWDNASRHLIKGEEELN